MPEFHNQMWVTSALSDPDVHKALVLCYSLRRTCTFRKISLIASPKISANLRKALDHGFDFVFYLEEDRNTAHLKPEDFAKLYSLVALRAFDMCAYLSPTMMALRNCDDIFAEPVEGFRLLEDAADTSVFLFKPSVKGFEALMTVVSGKNGTGLGSFLQRWTKSQRKHAPCLHEKYNQVLTRGNALLGYEKSISIVNLVDYPSETDIESLGKSTGILGQLVAVHWLKIQREDVLPLIGLSTSPLPASTETQLVAKYQAKEPIAIVGMSARYPSANNLDEFWQILFNGQDATGTHPEFRWARDQCSRNPEGCRKTNAGFLKVPVDEFDAKFFGISPKEVLFMDPQHRLLHEVVWESLEDACMDPQSLRGSAGSVFFGSWINDYRGILDASGNPEFYRTYMGNSIGAAAARISFLLGLTGPSIATESGCSSAIVAVHMACKSLQLGETNLALACGVNMLLHPFDKDIMPMVISPDGHCKTFSEDADGFARAEGCGVLVLKRLSDAVKNGDNIWGLIRGSAISQEGVSKSMGTPTVHCESLAMKDALLDSRVSPEEVSYVEAHGTGTSVGDPMEVAAIAKAYSSPNRNEPLIIGSVKTNVGHTESCSGITGIMKVILAMQHETIPAHLNLTKLNPMINLDAVPAVIPLERMEWKKTPGKPRLAGVSSFGITGTDAHVILEEAPAIPDSKILATNMERPLHLLKLSTKTEEAMSVLMENYKIAVQSSKNEMADIAYSTNIGRATFGIRTAIIAKNIDDMVNAIEQRKYLQEESNPENLGKICFLFTGQGSQYPGMAKTLYHTSPVFRMHFDYCEKILKSMYNISITDVLWSSKSSSEISRTIYSQTSIFCVEYALLKLWESWGVKPDYALGHSLGEFAAAVCAGILSVESAIKLVAERSRLIDELPRGKMLVIKADHQQVDKAMKRFAGVEEKRLLDYAAVNSNEQTVVAGDSDVVLQFSEFCLNNNLKCIVLEATHAFHSKHMNPILEAYRSVAKTIETQKKEEKCEYISGMKGDLVSGNEVDAQYWVDHTREKVSFLSASKKAVALGCTIFVEIGPQPVLSALTMMNNDTPLLCLPSLKRKEEEWTTLLTTVAKLYLKGVEIDWNGFDQFYTRKKVHQLPNYPFMGKKFWPDLMQATGNVIHPLIGAVIPNASSHKIFQCGVNLRSHEFIKDHAIGQTAVFPGAGYLEMCLAAGLATVEGALDSMNKPTRPMKVENLSIQAPLGLDESKTTQLQTVAELNKSSENEQDWNDVTVKIYHRMDAEMSEKWLSHASATFSPLPSAEEQNVTFDKAGFLETLSLPSDEETISKLYEKLASVGLKFGPVFKSLEKLWKCEEKNSMLVKVKVPFEGDGQSAQYIIHPAVIDAMIQAIMVLKLTGKMKKKLYVPIKVGKFLWLSNSASESEDRFIHVYDEPTNGKVESELSTDKCVALLLDSTGNVLAVMSAVEYIDTTDRAVESVLKQQTCPMPDLWEETWRAQTGPVQHSHNHKTCEVNSYYTDELYNDLVGKYNVLSPELQVIDNNIKALIYYNLLRCLYQCGFKPSLNAILNEENLITELKIDSKQTRMFGYFFRVLEEEGILKQEGARKWKVVKIPPSKEQVEQQLKSPVFTVELMSVFKCTSLLSKLGENLHSIVTGKDSALPILFPEEGPSKQWSSAGDFYIEYGDLYPIYDMIMSAARTILSNCKSQHDNNGERFIYRVCEIGAGTGMMTRGLLQIFDELDFEYEYTFTDISSAFFSGAEVKFEKHVNNMIFKKLNIEEDPISQGFTPAYYDLVVASDVVHATRNLKETFNHINMLSKLGGRFYMIEQSDVSRLITYVFGFLDGFWRFEDTDVRPNHCTLTGKKWVEALKYSGLETISTFPCSNNHHSFICTRKSKDISEVLQAQKVSYPSREESCRKTWVLFHQKDSATSKFLLEGIPSLTNRKLVAVEQGLKYQANFGKQDKCTKVSINPDSEDDFAQLIKFLEQSNGHSIEGIVYCWSLDKTCTTQDKILRPFFYLSKAVLRIQKSAGIRFVALTNGVAPFEDNDLSHFQSSTIWGFTKAMRNERNDLGCRCVDIGGNETESGLLQILYELWHPAKETITAYSGVMRHVPKLMSLKPSLSDLKLPPGTDRYCLILPETKSIQDLHFGPLQPLVLHEGEVEIQVKASALNFRDVLSVLKPSDDFKDSNSVGFDFAGVVKRLGPNVTKWSVGDNVYGVNIARTALPSHIKLNQEDILAIPDDMTYCEASTLPAVVATSFHCLIDIAKIKPSDTVLIHTASGGVGLSAIQICKHIGATIVATAGSKRKQNYLRSLGIKHIFHSRNTEYEKEILKLTNGRGVDVVLNSLTSEGFKEATLNSCAKGARFVEMSKLSIWEPEEVKRLRPDVEYTTIDLTQMNTSEWRHLMANVEDMAKKNVIQPIPYVRFDGVHIREALQYMQKAKHIGKVVCVLPEIRQHEGRTDVSIPMFNANATYLITGGLGGIGFLVCQWMLDNGAKYIVLAGRNPPNSEREQQIKRINAERNVNVVAVQLDVSNFEQCRELIQCKIPALGYPVLRGIMHAAGTLSDAIIENQTWENFECTFKSKVDGTINLHELTKENTRMEHFVLFSSIAAFLGSPGQSNHSAGNTLEDTFSHYRYSVGLPASSVNWGQWGEVGVATELDWPGLKPFSNLQGLAGLEYALKSQRTQTGVMNITSFNMLSKIFPHISSYLDERVLKSSSSASGGINVKPEEFWQKYDSLETVEDREDLLKQTLQFILRKILKLEETDVIDDNGNFQEMGVDSLMFVEIKNALQSLLGSRITINASILKDCNTVQLLAQTLVKVIEGIEIEDETIPTTEEIIELLKEDCVLPDHIRAKPEQQRVKVQDISNVLLTGVTGTLGPYVLRELAAHPQIKQIICLIRPRKNQSTEERLHKILKERLLLEEIDMSKVRCVEGNLASPNLGVEPIVWEELCNNVDAVFHCAASVQHMEHYRKRNSERDMRAVNVEGTRRVLEFACTGTKLKHVYLASSLLAATKVGEDGALSEEWPESDDFNGVTTLAYPTTKFIGDILMKEAVLRRGVPGKAFRFPLIIGDSRTGRFVLEQNHLMLRYFFILKNGIMPSNPFPIAMLPVDICAKASVQTFLCPEAPNEVYHVTNAPPDADQEFVRIAQKLGYNVDVIEFAEFAQKVTEATSEDSPFVIFRELYKLGEDVLSFYNTSPPIRQWVLDGGSNPEFMNSKKMAKYYPEFFDDACSAMDHVYRDLMFAKSQGWLDKYASS